ncbi:MAG: lamin tail domain-containing protein, partial [Pseudomonadales bacterium]|nr:lamin tail domain-containing protein [Pseudomonadales bacterium]
MSKMFRILLQYILFSLVGLLSVTEANATPVFINEIHYDNTGSDVNEGVEIAGPANTDLTGWSLVLYNGSNGQSYSTRALSGAIVNSINGFGVLSFAYSGIQNGAPDGVALVDDANQLIQFLSYEGVIHATSGVAAGQSSIDILVQEPASTLVGTSLQLLGTGTEYEDFQWGQSAPQTFGALN